MTDRPRIGDRVKYTRRGSTVRREGTVERYTYSRTGRELLQVRIDTVGGHPLMPCSTVRIDERHVEIVSRWMR